MRLLSRISRQQQLRLASHHLGGPLDSAWGTAPPPVAASDPRSVLLQTIRVISRFFDALLTFFSFLWNSRESYLPPHRGKRVQVIFVTAAAGLHLRNKLNQTSRVWQNRIQTVKPWVYPTTILMPVSMQTCLHMYTIRQTVSGSTGKPDDWPNSDNK